MSMKPGVTVLPLQSTVRAAARPARSPTAVMRSPVIATSARRAALPVPSITSPPASLRSHSMAHVLPRRSVAETPAASSSAERLLAVRRMENLPRFMAYAADFEKTLVDDDWSRLRQYFADDAVYEVKAESFGCKLSGPDAIFKGI